MNSTTESHAQEYADTVLQPNARNVDAFVEDIRAAYKDSIDAVFEMGNLLRSAKKELSDADFSNMIATKLPFGIRTAERLMAIARHSALAAATYELLPPAWGTLYILTALPGRTVEKEIDTGAIHTDMLRKEAQALVYKHKKGKKGKKRSTIHRRPDLKEANEKLRTELEAKEAHIEELQAVVVETLDDARNQYGFVVAMDQATMAAELDKLKQLISEASKAGAA